MRRHQDLLSSLGPADEIIEERHAFRQVGRDVEPGHEHLASAVGARLRREIELRVRRTFADRDEVVLAESGAQTTIRSDKISRFVLGKIPKDQLFDIQPTGLPRERDVLVASEKKPSSPLT